jgi:hypothetical protein
MDAMIVNRTMPKNKTIRALKLTTKCLKNKNTPNVSKFLRIVESNFNISFFHKQHALIPCWKLIDGSMKE